MAISIDALLAMILFIVIAAYISIEPVSQIAVTQPKIAVNQLVDDAVAAIDNTGMLMESIESGDGNAVVAKLDALLPENVGFRLEMMQNESTLDQLGSTCRADQTIESCFPQDANEFFSTNEPVPEDTEVFHGRKILIKKEPGDCKFEAGFSQAAKLPSAYFQGNHAPEARDVNIVAAGTCPNTRHPCPATDDTMRCCYEYYDYDSDPEADHKYKWYLFDEDAPGDHWVLTGEEGATIPLDESYDGNRWKCSVAVSDGTDWSQDSNSPFSIVGGPCFQFSAEVTQGGSPITQFECDQDYDVSFTVTAEAGGRKTPADIILTLDRSGSMSWGGIKDGAYNSSETPMCIFVDESQTPNRVYLGTSGPDNDTPGKIYRFDINSENGGFVPVDSVSAVDDVYAIYVDGDYVYAADGDAGLTVFNKSDMSRIRTIGEEGEAKEMTTVRSIVVEGNYIYAAAAGTYSEGGGKKYGAEMDAARTSGEEEYIGYSISRSWAVQSFSTGIQDINGAEIEVRRIGNPGNLTVHLRSTLTGADLPNGTVIVSASGISTSWGTWLDIDFPGEAIDITPGQTYYLALTTSGQSSSNYYQWGSRKDSPDPYKKGALYRCTSAGSCTEQFEEGSGWDPDLYEDARFRVYNYSSIVGGLVIINKSDADPNNWNIISNLYNTGAGYIDRPQDVAVSGNYAYLADKSGGDGTEGLWVVNVSNKTNPVLAGFESTSNAYHVAVSGDYAYIADPSDGLHVIDIQNKSNPQIVKTLNSLGTVDEVEIYDTNAYVSADTGSLATGYGLHIIDISDPPNASKILTSYSQFAFAGDDSFGLFVTDEYAILTFEYSQSMVTLDRIFGSKMNISRNAAKDFVMFEDWDTPLDKLGLVSYGNNTGTLDHELADASQANKASIAASLDTLLAYNGTPMDKGLEAAIDELTGSRGREDAIQFIVLLADGQSDSGTQTGINTQVARAKSNGIYVFTIGLGGDVDDSQMKNIASCAYCPDNKEADCKNYTPVAGDDCGKYHHITDPSALTEVYELIADQIADLTGRLPDRDETDISMKLTGFGGLILSDIAPADECTLADGILDCIGLNIRTAWTGSFTASIPCDYAGCSADFFEGHILRFPPEDTSVFFTVEDEEQFPVQWPDKFSIGSEFYYNDLGVEFLDGQFYGTKDTVLQYKISNLGYVDDVDLSLIDPTAAFYENTDNPLYACQPDVSIGEVNFDEILDAAYGADAGSDTSVEESSNVLGSGYICIWINKDGDIAECLENNKVVVHCAIPKTYVYVLDYWAWEK